MEVPTVRVVNFDGGPLVINEADFDPAVHQLYEEPKKKPKPEKAE